MLLELLNILAAWKETRFKIIASFVKKKSDQEMKGGEKERNETKEEKEKRKNNKARTNARIE